jgi:hypothetical protein
MDRSRRDAPRRARIGAAPHLQCLRCKLPIALTSVERDGNHRSITCPFCSHHDDWVVEER